MSSKRMGLKLPSSKWSKRLLLGVVGLTLTGEFLLRLVWGFGHPLLLQKDPDIGYMFQADQDLRRFGNRVQINQFHQRSPNKTDVIINPDYRVLMVGDSVTFGGTLVDQSDTVSACLENYLSEALSNSVSVLNASAGSWGLGNHLAYLRRFGVFDAQIVVMQIGSHDLLQVKSNSSRVGVDPSMPDHNPWFAINELVFRYLVPKLWHPSSAAGRMPTGPSDLAIRFEENMRSLAQSFAMVREAGAIPIILHTPDRNEVGPDPKTWETKYESWRSRFLELARTNDVPVVNLVSMWRGTNFQGSWFRDGVHMTAEGNRVAASLLVRELGPRLQFRKNANHPYHAQF